MSPKPSVSASAARPRTGSAKPSRSCSKTRSGAIGRAFEAREKASQAQEVAMGALNIPSAADIERLTRRLRAVSHRLEGIEDGVDRLDRALAPSGVEARLAAIETHLQAMTDKLDRAISGRNATDGSATPAAGVARARPSGARTRAAKAAGPAKTAKATSAAKAAKAAKAARAAKTPGGRSRAARAASGKA
jgi:hypothetical protein